MKKLSSIEIFLKNNQRLTMYLLLHILFAMFSLSGVCSKMAAYYPFFSIKFCAFYALSILVLGFYAIGWQQIIKKLSLTTAFANRAITTAWGLIWGIVFFGEQVTLWKIVGIILVICGIVIFSKSDKVSDIDE